VSLFAASATGSIKVPAADDVTVPLETTDSSSPPAAAAAAAAGAQESAETPASTAGVQTPSTELTVQADQLT